MGRRLKILFTGLSYLNRNYGAQGIAFPLMEKIRKHFDAEYTFALPEKYYEDNLPFSRKHRFNLIPNPKGGVFFERGWTYLLYFFLCLFGKKLSLLREEKKKFTGLVQKLKESNVVIDLSGIEFVGSLGFKRKWLDYLFAVYMQHLAEKYNKLYLKYTKSYGPFLGKIYRFFVRRELNKLPFVFVRGEGNLEEVKRLNLKVPVYSFPDISIILEPEKREWAIKYLSSLGLDSSKPITGISPSSAIASIHILGKNSSCGPEHIRLSREIIKFYSLKNQQVLIIPHSVREGKDPRTCDLALSKIIYAGLEKKKNVFLIDDLNLTYKQVRAIIGLLDFYITGRYHSVTSALSMGIPVVSLSWHRKYKDLMSLFLEDFLVIDCRATSVENSLSLIERYYHNRQWFKKREVLKRKREVAREIEKSLDILVEEIKKFGRSLAYESPGG